MADVYEWLENVDQPTYAPASPPFAALPVPAFDPVTASHFIDLTVDQDAILDMPYAWEPPVESQIPIDPVLQATTETFVKVPQQYAEASSKLLIYLAQVIDLPETLNELDKNAAAEMTFTAEELEALEPVPEDDSLIPATIDGVCVNVNPRSAEIHEVIDLRRIGPDRQTYYLARTANGKYYWFHSPREDRDRHLCKLIGDCRHKAQAEAEATRRRTQGVKKLRSGKVVKI
jgi:hypothetical protein